MASPEQSRVFSLEELSREPPSETAVLPISPLQTATATQKADTQDSNTNNQVANTGRSTCYSSGNSSHTLPKQTSLSSPDPPKTAPTASQPIKISRSSNGNKDPKAAHFLSHTIPDSLLVKSLKQDSIARNKQVAMSSDNRTRTSAAGDAQAGPQLDIPAEWKVLGRSYSPDFPWHSNKAYGGVNGYLSICNTKSKAMPKLKNFPPPSNSVC